MRKMFFALVTATCFLVSCASAVITPTVENVLVLPVSTSDTPLDAPTLVVAPQAMQTTSGLVVEEPTPFVAATTASVNISQEIRALPLRSFDVTEFGKSVQGRSLMAYRLGNGPVHRALIGGIHGGYEFNTVQLMSETLSYLKENPNLISKELTLFIIPDMNPDGVARGNDAKTGRMNANNVDLNRNWDYKWQITATHGTRPVFSGKEPFRSLKREV